MATTTGRDLARVSKSFKSSLSSDCGLQLDHMKLESLVIVDQLRRGEYVLEPCTRDAVRHMSKSVKIRPQKITILCNEIPVNAGDCISQGGWSEA